MVVWDRNDYIVEGEKQLSGENISQDNNFKDKILQELPDNSSNCLKVFQRKRVVLKKKLSTSLLNLKRPHI